MYRSGESLPHKTKGGITMDVMYRITFRCNSKCDFCYNHAFANKVDFSANEEKNISKLLSFISENSISRCVISGGEPAVREDLPIIVSQIANVTKVKIFTNGLLLIKYSPLEIQKMGIEKVVYTIKESDVRQPVSMQNMLEKIDEVRKIGIVVDGNAFLTSHYFDDKERIIHSNILSHFDNVRWQPLIYPESSVRYSETIWGMDERLRKQIFEDVIHENWGGIAVFYSEFERIFAERKQILPCKYPHRVVCVDPDLCAVICPHKNENRVSLETILHKVTEYSFDSCFCPQCMSIYSF